MLMPILDGYPLQDLRVMRYLGLLAPAADGLT
jgi:hypothetical protein